MINNDKLKGVMREERITQEVLSKHLNLSVSTLSKKLNGEYRWYVNEYIETCNYLNKPFNFFLLTGVPI